MKSFKKNNSTTSQTPSDTSQMANASDTSKTSFAEGWEREYRVYSNSTQKDEEFESSQTTSQMAEPIDKKSQMANASDRSLRLYLNIYKKKINQYYFNVL